MDKSGINIKRAGEFFIYSIWIQSQMSDLIILKKYPNFIDAFLKNPSKIPNEMHQQRVKYWEKNFGAVKDEFKQVFSDMLYENELNDLESVYYIRNHFCPAKPELRLTG